MTAPKFTDEQDAILQRAIETYGEESQIRMCLEEMTELSYELLKYLREQPSISDTVGSSIRVEKVRDEIADARVTIRQMEILFGEEEVQKHIDYKVDRLRKRLDKHDQKEMGKIPRCLDCGSLNIRVNNKTTTIMCFNCNQVEGEPSCIVCEKPMDQVRSEPKLWLCSNPKCKEKAKKDGFLYEDDARDFLADPDGVHTCCNNPQTPNHMGHWKCGKCGNEGVVKIK